MTLTDEELERRRFTRAIAFAVIFATIFATVLGFVAVRSLDAGRAADRAIAANTAAIKAACENANAVRAAQITLWEHIIELTPPKTTEDEQRIKDFRAFIAETFAPRDCSGV